MYQGKFQRSNLTYLKIWQGIGIHALRVPKKLSQGIDVIPTVVQANPGYFVDGYTVPIPG